MPGPKVIGGSILLGLRITTFPLVRRLGPWEITTFSSQDGPITQELKTLGQPLNLRVSSRCTWPTLKPEGPFDRLGTCFVNTAPLPARYDALSSSIPFFFRSAWPS